MKISNITIYIITLMQNQETEQFIQSNLTSSNVPLEQHQHVQAEHSNPDVPQGQNIDDEQEANQEVKSIQKNRSSLINQVGKQRSLQQFKNIGLKKQTSTHLELEIEYPQQQFNFQEENKYQQKKQDKKNNSMLICIEDSQVIPTVYLQSSPKGQKFISIKIPMYRTTTFMKLETQIFILDVKKPGSVREYQIERRYSDFVDLYQSLFYNQPGYILAPFPDKGVESFIKIKLGIGTSQPGERQQMIEKRMLDLEKFINFITHHQELSNSEQLVNFITQDQSVFQEGKKRLQKYVYQNRSLQKNSQIKNIIGLGKNLWTSYFKSNHTQQKIDMSTISIGKNDIQFGVILETVKTQKQKTQQKYNQFLKLYMAQKSFSQFVDMPTQNDFLLKLCAKHSSGKEESKLFSSFLQIQVLDEYRYNIKQFQEVEKILLYRIQIWECLEETKKQKNKGKKQKLTRRLEMFERNFLNDWENIFVFIQKKNKKIYSKFLEQWVKHKNFMKKLWRH